MNLWTQFKQRRILAKHAAEEKANTLTFCRELGTRMVRETLASRCAAVYEIILEWSEADPDRLQSAATFLFLWELCDKEDAKDWEVSDIVEDLVQMWTLRKPSCPLPSQTGQQPS